mgnify:CR=1 FL=1
MIILKKVMFILALLLASSFLASAPLCAEDGKAAATAEVSAAKEGVKKIDAKDVQRVSPADIYEKVQTGEALLVCAYPDDEKFAKSNLKGAISFKRFETMLKDIDQSKLIVFY